MVSSTMEILNVSQPAGGCGLSIQAFVEWSRKEEPFGELEQNRIPVQVDYLNSLSVKFSLPTTVLAG